jgi:hypothetical protein
MFNMNIVFYELKMSKQKKLHKQVCLRCARSSGLGLRKAEG